jgi:hypothetical protein
MTSTRFLLLSLIFCLSFSISQAQQLADKNPNLSYTSYSPKSSDQIIDREAYASKIYGFWLATCIANWTGLVTEMDKIGKIETMLPAILKPKALWTGK